MRYGVNTNILLILCIFTTLIGVSQIVIQSLIAANVLSRSDEWLQFIGFTNENDIYNWVLYLSVDILLLIITPVLYYLHNRRNSKYQKQSLNIFTISNIIKQNNILISNFDNKESDPLLNVQESPSLPLYYVLFLIVLLIIIATLSPSILHIPYFILLILVASGKYKSFENIMNIAGILYLFGHLTLITLYQIDKIGANIGTSLLGLFDFHNVTYFPYSNIRDTHIVPALMTTIAMLSIFYLLGVRPILLHSSSCDILVNKEKPAKPHSPIRPYVPKRISAAILEPLKSPSKGNVVDIIDSDSETDGLLQDTEMYEQRGLFSLPRFRDSLSNAVHSKLDKIGTFVVKPGALGDVKEADMDFTDDEFDIKADKKEVNYDDIKEDNINIRELYENSRKSSGSMKKSIRKTSHHSIPDVTSDKSGATHASGISNFAQRQFENLVHWTDAFGKYLTWIFFLYGPILSQIALMWSTYPQQDAFFIR